MQPLDAKRWILYFGSSSLLLTWWRAVVCCAFCSGHMAPFRTPAIIAVVVSFDTTKLWLSAGQRETTQSAIFEDLSQSYIWKWLWKPSENYCTGLSELVDVDVKFFFVRKLHHQFTQLLMPSSSQKEQTVWGDQLLQCFSSTVLQHTGVTMQNVRCALKNYPNSLNWSQKKDKIPLWLCFKSM